MAEIAGKQRDNGTATLALTGDVMLGRLMNAVLHEEGPRYPWGNTLPLLREADLTLMNLECVIATQGHPWNRWPKVFHFQADPIALEALIEAGTNCVTLANNHVLDWGEGALLEMLTRLDSAGIRHTGAGRNLEEASRPAVLEARGVRVGALAFTDNEPGWAASEDRPGTNYLPVSTEAEQFDRVRQSIAATRDLGADLVIFSNHWGPNMRERPPEEFRQFARATLDAGADLYLGHSAHLFQGIEIYHGKPIFYDAGDFVDDYAVDPILRNDRSALILCTASVVGVERIQLLPILIENFQAKLATGSEFASIALHIQALSAELGSRVTVEKSALAVPLGSRVPR